MSERERLERLLNAGLEISGNTAAGALSAAVGWFVAGPVGAAIGGATGAALSIALKRLGSEVAERLLSPREQARIGFVLGQAVIEIRKRIDQGEALREDGFFDAQQGGRSNAEEVAESVLLKSQREAEERKLASMAHLLANIAFDPAISAEMAHQITKIAEQLTYRQLCILKLAVVKGLFSLRDTNYHDYGSFPKQLYSILYEYCELCQREYIANGNIVVVGLTDIIPSQANIQGLGVDMYRLMRLDAIPDADIAPIAEALK